jgi:hypothetical protein
MASSLTDTFDPKAVSDEILAAKLNALQEK